ncbi:hypothetical protein EYZ11_009315 [Aspergillus tanneri]|uniref:2EXR domain-containing protein n=1 Tax=Aspergillus tanneri TaxID=1220188 RepID=A0A4S3J8N2_9EURO|nr:uncharacterized protein ATNIH1004_009152 [Aspergillus tanneri]KAA8644941.1 hypothetical protein ATNIH1004_009152 [Aspergillus tanneri]THC91235.1 hypothetical protein EYZ11_009315 [Aspergillus tanneri]
MVWEYTWPTTQVIEAASWETFDDDEYEESTILRPVGTLNTLLGADFSCRHLEIRSPVEHCLPPIALWICHESRVHTLKQYTLIQHPDLSECSFYFSPRRDLLWLSCDITSETERLDELQASYGASLDNFRALLAEDTEWEFWDQDQSSSPLLSILPALQTIVLVADDFDDDGTPNTYSSEEYRKLAADYRNEYSKFCESLRLNKPFQLEYIDRGGNSY